MAEQFYVKQCATLSTVSGGIGYFVMAGIGDVSIPITKPLPLGIVGTLAQALNREVAAHINCET